MKGCKELTENASLFQHQLEQLAREEGADLFGVADLMQARSFIREQGGDYACKFGRAISVGIRLSDAIVDDLHKHNDTRVILAYDELYTRVNSHLDQISSTIANRILLEGYHACAVAASDMVDSDRLTGLISHKLVANLAGLGWIGKSCLLITPSYGPRVRFSSILTDAPLEVGTVTDSNCNGCTQCLEICPVNAFTGASFDPSEPREARFHAHLCDAYMTKRQTAFGRQGLCGLCVYVCPHGRLHPDVVR